MMRRSVASNVNALLACARLATSLNAAERPFEGPLKAFLGEPGMEMRQVFKSERFPNIVVTLEGTVLATWGNICLGCWKVSQPETEPSRNRKDSCQWT